MKENYAFIDSQNLNLAIRDLGWKLNFVKFRIYLWDKYRIKKAYLFIGYIHKNVHLYKQLRKAGYLLIFKPTYKNSQGIIKGNCDAELVLHCMIEFDNFDKAIVVSGDGDFYCLIEYLLKNSKLLKIGIPNKANYSSLLRKFSNYHFYVSKLPKKIGGI